jgi:hypothetical protein
MSIDSNINTKYYSDTFSTGDIILFNGNGFISDVIERVTHSEWSHVGMVVKDPDYLIQTPPTKGLFLFESDIPASTDPCIDIDTGRVCSQANSCVSGRPGTSTSGERLRGVSLVHLKERIEQYDGGVAYRKLNWDKTESEINNMFKIVYNTTYHKKYDVNPLDLIDPLVHHKYWIIDKLCGSDPRQVNKFFCSSLLAYTYTQLGLLKSNTEWSEIYPKYFAEDITLENGASLGNITILKNKVSICNEKNTDVLDSRDDVSESGK